jgi:hypothetical protein
VPAKPVEVAAVKPVETTVTIEAEKPAIVKPIAKPANLAGVALKPGTWVMVANQLVPIPKQKPKQ